MKNLLFYSWDKVVLQNKNNVLKIFDTFNSFNIFGVPDIYSGNSFLINSLGIINSNHTEKEKIDYLYLASLRNYFDYKYENDLSLYYYFSDLATERVLNNTALLVENEKIYFKYEELYGN